MPAPTLDAAPTFFWHDYETFGRDPRRDRPAQFAGVRTDAELNEVGQPLVAWCQPPRDTLPDPEACLLTGITPQHCAERGLPERVFAGRIHAALATPGTIGVGYNSLRFDDEVSRHLFWRNLIDPYGREWQQGCGRWDLLDVVRTAWALRPEGLQWPRHEDGRPSFKLEHLSAANGLAHAHAHDALSDVRATVALARLLRARQPRLWAFCLKLRRKEAVAQEIGIGRPFLHLSGRYPTERGCMALVWPLAPHPSNRNELIVWDLAEHPEQLLGLDAAMLKRRLFSRAADLPEGETRLPIKTIHLNRSPVVIANLETLGAAQAERWQLDKTRGLAHARWAADQADALRACPWPEVFARPPDEDDRLGDVDANLYGGFVGPPDRRLLERLRLLEAEDLARQRPAFEDGRLDELLLRYRARHWPQTLDADEAERWQAHLQERLHEGRPGYLTLAAYSERIDTLAEALADDLSAEGMRRAEVLEALVDWAAEVAP